MLAHSYISTPLLDAINPKCLAGNMFSSVHPGVPANIKSMHNPSLQVSNRYVKSSTNPNVTYVANPHLYDLGYVSILPTEGPPHNWYPNSSYSPSYGQEYTIYSTSAPTPFSYDQSTDFLDFEDTSSITTDSTASPALSTDSLETLKSPVDDESVIDELDIRRSENRATRSSFPPQVAMVGRASSTYPSDQQFTANITPFQPVTGDLHNVPRALHPPFSSDLEDCRSTISELEVEERDRIAKINAEYNATSYPGFYRNSSTPPQALKYPADHLRESNSASQLSSMQTRPCLRLTASQPRHPDLHFHRRPDPSSLPYQIYANSVSSTGLDPSPPSVERLPSQLPLQQIVNMDRNLPQSQSSPQVGSCSYEGNPDRSRIIQNTTSSPTGSTHSVSQVGHSSDVAINPQHQPYTSSSERISSSPPSSTVHGETTKQNCRSSVSITNGQSLVSDVRECLQYGQQSLSDAAGSTHSPTAKTQFSSYNASPDLRQNAQVFRPSPLGKINQGTEVESTDWISLGSNLRRDTKTPGPSGRSHSYTRSSLDSPSSSSRDLHNNTDILVKEVPKSSPRRFSDDTSSHLDNGRTPSEAPSPVVPSREHSSIPQSIWLPHDDAAPRHTTKAADNDREFERNRRLRGTGTERTAVPKISDVTSQVTAPGMHIYSPLFLSSEGGALAQPDSQDTSVVTAPEPTPTDLHHSRMVYDQASAPNSFGSRESHNVREGQYANPAKPKSENPKRGGKGVRMPSSVLPSSPVNIATTSSSPSSKATFDSPPATVLPEPHRRHSDGDQVGPPIRTPLDGRNSAPLVRSVRWTEDLIAPSPILGPPRRKGWFNRKGDQLWTNSGDYRSPRPGDDYPLDLNDYPEPGDGWMNEDGVRIDMSHRRIPKAVPRPVLKRP